MHDDLRRRALESGKTTSNKAKSKPTSRSNSRPTSKRGSKVGSRITSRDASDDEDGNGNLSDDTNFSANSIDAILDNDELNDATPEALKQELNDCMADLLERKGSSIKSREDSLTTFDHILTAHYLTDAIDGRVSSLLSAFSRSIKTETSERETLLAFRAVSLIAISVSDDTIYETMATLVKQRISDSESNVIKAAAIQCLGNCVSFGGGGEDEIAECMTFLLEIISSDGTFVSAEDSVEVVTAALQTYGFLSTQIEDLEDESEAAITAFLDQLDSGDARVQIAAGEDIAALYEKSYSPAGEDDTTSDFGDHEGTSSSGDEAGDTSLVKRYTAYHNTHDVLTKASSLASLSTKSMGKREKRELHQTFASVVMTVENPKVGLQTTAASKMTVRIHQTGEMKVDKWWKLMRLNALRRLLGGGFINHYFEGNKQVLDALPILVRYIGGNGTGSPRVKPESKASKGRFNNMRKFIG